MSNPSVSIVMPTYNATRFLQDTVNAALSQTFHDFELIIVDDGSSDGTAESISRFTDQRIRFIPHDCNKGVAAATNTGLRAARGRYVAMMDHDDISMPYRLERQINFLEAHPEIDGCGGAHIILGKNSSIDGLKAAWKTRYGTLLSAEDVAAGSLWAGQLFNPTVCFRTNTLHRLDKWWDEKLSVGADDEFYGRLIGAGAAMCVLPDVVLRYRRHRSSLSLSSHQRAIQTRASVALAGLSRIMPDATQEQQRIHVMIALRDYGLTPEILPRVTDYMEAILAANASSGRYAEQSLKRVMALHWSRVCALAGCKNLRTACRAYYTFSPLREYVGSPAFFLYQWQKRRLSSAARHPQQN